MPNRPLTVLNKNSVKQQGFTLVEMLVTIAVMAIIVAMAAPSFTNQIASKRIDSTANVFVTAFQTAKSEALVKRKNIDIEIDNSTKQIKVQTTDSTPILINKYEVSKSSIMDAKESAPAIYTVSPNGMVMGKDNAGTHEALKKKSYYEICDGQVSGERGKKITISAVGQVQVISSGVICS